MFSQRTEYQTIILGIENLDGLLRQLTAGKVLLVADASFPYLSIKDQLENMAVPYILFDQFSPNPLYEDVCKGVRLFNEQQCDAIVAVGGGSSIDVAKCIKLYCKMDPAVNYLQQEPFDSGIPLVAIPTTAGTGSESTRFAVIYYEGKKQSVNHLSIIPNYALLEPSVLETLPLYQKKCTVLDALCQSIESWWSVNSTEESKQISKAALETLTAALMPYVSETAEPRSPLVASNVMRAANMAGQAINITQTTAPHAFSYKITSLYHLPHGHAVAVCLPHIWRYMLEHPERCIDSRGAEYLDGVFCDIAAAMGCNSPSEAVDRFEKLLRDLELGGPHSDNRAADMEVLVHSVNPVRLKNNPVGLDLEAIREIYEKVIF